MTAVELRTLRELSIGKLLMRVRIGGYLRGVTR